MTRLLDNLIAIRILKMLVTPFNETDAYRLGIIDEHGKILKKASQLHTEDEKDAYTLLHRLVFRMKRIIERVPLENKKFVSMAAAYALIRESYANNKEPIDLEQQFYEAIKHPIDTTLVEQYMTNSYIKSFKAFLDEDAMGAGAVAGNNAAVTPGVAGVNLTPSETPPVPANNKLKVQRRKPPNGITNQNS